MVECKCGEGNAISALTCFAMILEIVNVSQDKENDKATKMEILISNELFKIARKNLSLHW